MRILLRRLGTTILFLLVPFAIATVLGGWGHAPDLPGGIVPTAAVVIGLLAADVGLPVPSSAVLVAAGAALGPITGAIAGTIGVVAGAAVGYALGSTMRFSTQLWCSISWRASSSSVMAAPRASS